MRHKKVFMGFFRNGKFHSIKETPHEAVFLLKEITLIR